MRVCITSCSAYYLKKQNELWESLNGLHYQAIKSHAVTAGFLTMLYIRTTVIIKQIRILHINVHKITGITLFYTVQVRENICNKL